MYQWGTDLFEGILGKENSGYIPYLMTVGLFLVISNTMGLIGIKPPQRI
ncbi:F0F1 ATP synthase subunit A [Suipraeoptans intestinalis]|nr:F0F1 ATP synthase subunit A [Suipraeoptans intestinalis]